MELPTPRYIIFLKYQIFEGIFEGVGNAIMRKEKSDLREVPPDGGRDRATEREDRE